MDDLEQGVSRETLVRWVDDARRQMVDLVSDLSDEQLWGPRLETTNPLLWEVGHVAWFQEKWVLRCVLGRDPLRPEADELYDSAAVAHDTRWDLHLPPRDRTFAYACEVRSRVIDALQSAPLTKRLAYHVQYSVFHGDMHCEALVDTRQRLSYPPPKFRDAGFAAPASGERRCVGDAEVHGGKFLLGASDDGAFVFDNEKWAHPVRVDDFAISRTPVTQAEFAAFVEEGGYRRQEFWSEVGWRWRVEAGATFPAYWRREPTGEWLRREFDRWLPLAPNHPMLHVNWFEADAWCRWARRRLPSEAEWEIAASGVPGATGRLIPGVKRRFPWGDDAPTPERTNLDGRTLGAVDVDQLPGGDSAFGCRQMIGNVWEWTASDFLPYPGFTPDPYREYSQPWFGSRKVLRGGCWATRSRLIRNTWRNYYTPDRRDIFAGFRTCALHD
jgi:gamma-glutamyl hercynylcysteine S-oxide synthase